jgi:putative hydrolase of the HAD superfamily
MTSGEIHHLRNFGFSHFIAEYTDHGQTFFMHHKHQFEGLCVGHAKEPFQHMHHKLHRSVVVIQQQHFVQRRLLGFGFGFCQQCLVAVRLVGRFVGHSDGQRINDHEWHRFAISGSGWLGIGRLYIRWIPVLKRPNKQAFYLYMAHPLKTIAFDADDTLWHNERFFKLTQKRFAAILADFADPIDLDARLLAAERRNIGHYGYGIKGFMLSMIETAIDVTNGKVQGHVIKEILTAGNDMLGHPIELLPHAQQAVEAMSATHKVLLITKGDLLDQERKLAQSGLGEMFDGVEIVSEKNPETYRKLFENHGTLPAETLMVGNSMKSDVLPVLDVGGWGVHVPHDLAWALEHADEPKDHERYRMVNDLGDLPALVNKIESGSA